MPPGKAPIRSALVVTALGASHSQPQGIGSYNEVRDWLFTQHGIGITEKPLATFQHTTLQLNPKVVRLRHRKKPDRESHAVLPARPLARTQSD